MNQETTMTIDAILSALARQRILINDEKSLQADLACVFDAAGIEARREVPIKGGVIDFVAGSIGIEVKVSGQGAAIRRQIKGYLCDERITGLVLITLRPIQCPPELMGKPVRVFELGNAWL